MSRAWVLLLLPGLLQAQAALGRLYYVTGKGRAVSFQVVAAGAGRLTLAPEIGTASSLRAFVLAHAGAESRTAIGARPLSDPVPAAWKGGVGSTDLVQNAEATFWRHAPGQVVPARFRADGQTWQLLAADLPMGRGF
jgi:hypothetical protein